VAASLVVYLVFNVIFKVLLDRLTQVVHKAKRDNFTEAVIRSQQKPLHLEAEVIKEPECLGEHGRMDRHSDQGQVDKRVTLGIEDVHKRLLHHVKVEFAAVCSLPQNEATEQVRPESCKRNMKNDKGLIEGF